MAEAEKKYTFAYGQLRRLTSTIDCQIRQMSVSERADLVLPIGNNERKNRNLRRAREFEERAERSAVRDALADIDARVVRKFLFYLILQTFLFFLRFERAVRRQIEITISDFNFFYPARRAGRGGWSRM